MIAVLIMSIPFQFIAEVFNLTAITIAKGELLNSLDTLQKKEIILLLLSLYNNMVSVGQMFWGLWLFPFGLLVYRSGFVPCRLGILLILGGIGYLTDYLAFLLSPSWRSVTVLALLFGLLSEMIIMAWLLIAGTKKTSTH
jgi:hypothetical protein